MNEGVDGVIDGWSADTSLGSDGDESCGGYRSRLVAAYLQHGIPLRGHAQVVTCRVSAQLRHQSVIWINSNHFNLNPLTYSLYIRSPTFVVLMLEQLELLLVLCVRFEDGGGVECLYAVFIEVRYLVCEEEAVDALILVVGSHRYEQQVEVLHMFGLEGTEYMEPAEGEELTATLAHGVADIGHAQTYAYYLIILVDDDGHEVEVQYWEVDIAVVEFLSLGHRLEVIELLVRLVEHVHKGVAVLTYELFGVLDLIDADVTALLHYLRYARHLLRHFLRAGDEHLHPVRIFLQSVSVHMLDVIRVVIERGEWCYVLEALEQQSLMIPVGKAYGAVHFRHSTLFAPGGYSIQEGTTDFEVVDEVHPAEAHMLHVPSLVGFLVDERCDTTDYLTLAVSKEKLEVTKVHRGVLLAVKHRQLVQKEWRAIIRAVLIQVVGELNKLLNLSFTIYRMYFYHSVEIAGFEPASKQGTDMLSTRLSWPSFSCNGKTQATNRYLIC